MSKEQDQKDWAEVFEAYPKATQIFVCDGQPFLTKSAAGNHARTVGKDVETINRPAAAEEQSQGNATKTAKTSAKGKAQKKAPGGEGAPGEASGAKSDEGNGE
jgi:hypothetical protein